MQVDAFGEEITYMTFFFLTFFDACIRQLGTIRALSRSRHAAAAAAKFVAPPLPTLAHRRAVAADILGRMSARRLWSTGHP